MICESYLYISSNCLSDTFTIDLYMPKAIAISPKDPATAKIVINNLTLDLMIFLTDILFKNESLDQINLIFSKTVLTAFLGGFGLIRFAAFSFKEFETDKTTVKAITITDMTNINSPNCHLNIIGLLARSVLDK